MPLNFKLSMEARAGHTIQAMIRIQKGIESDDQLRASPSAANSAMGRLNTVEGSAFAGTRG